MSITSEYLELKDKGLLTGHDLRIKITKFEVIPNANKDSNPIHEAVHGSVVGNHDHLELGNGDVVMVRMLTPRDGNRMISDLRTGSRDYGDGPVSPQEIGDEVIFSNCRPMGNVERSGTRDRFVRTTTETVITSRWQFDATDFTCVKDLAAETSPGM